MKKLLILFAVAAIGLMAGCGDGYDDAALNGRLDSIERRMAALETVMRAYENNLFVQSVEKTEDGYIIIFSDNTTAEIFNGPEGEKGDPGETFIARVETDDNEVTFVLTDGRTFSMMLYSALSVGFDEEDLLVMQANSLREIHYIVASLIPEVEVEVLTSADIKARVVPAGPAGGVIEVRTGAEIGEDSYMVVLVSNGKQMIMRRFTFEEWGLQVEDNTTRNIALDGDKVILEYLSNVECEVVIPEAARSWISVLPMTRVMEERVVVLKVERNMGESRSATVTLQTPDGLLKVAYRIEQEAGYYCSSDFSRDGEVVVLQKATDGNGIDIVLLGDAYSDRQIADGTYMNAMRAMADNLFDEEPYRTFKNLFNVYVVNVVSRTEGYDHGTTALEGYFGDGTFVGGNNGTCFSYARRVISQERMDETLIVVAMNKDAYAGTCHMYAPSYTGRTYGGGTAVAYFPTSSNTATFTGLVHHEALGHGFAKLADEYSYDYMGAISNETKNTHLTQLDNWGWWKNVDFTADLSAIRWNYFLSDPRYDGERLGAYEGGLVYAKGVWRPRENSIMRYNSGGFNAPSREAIYYRIHKLAYGTNWVYDYEDFAKYDEINRNTGAALRAYTPAGFVPTHPPVVVNRSWREE